MYSFGEWLHSSEPVFPLGGLEDRMGAVPDISTGELYSEENQELGKCWLRSLLVAVVEMERSGEMWVCSEMTWTGFADGWDVVREGGMRMTWATGKMVELPIEM